MFDKTKIKFTVRLGDSDLYYSVDLTDTLGVSESYTNVTGEYVIKLFALWTIRCEGKGGD